MFSEYWKWGRGKALGLHCVDELLMDFNSETLRFGKVLGQ